VGVNSSWKSAQRSIDKTGAIANQQRFSEILLVESVNGMATGNWQLATGDGENLTAIGVTAWQLAVGDGENLTAIATKDTKDTKCFATATATTRTQRSIKDAKVDNGDRRNGVAVGRWQMAVGNGEDLTAKTQQRVSSGSGLMCGLGFGRLEATKPQGEDACRRQLPTAICQLPRFHPRVLRIRCKRRSPGPETRMRLYQTPPGQQSTVTSYQ